MIASKSGRCGSAGRVAARVVVAVVLSLLLYGMATSFVVMPEINALAQDRRVLSREEAAHFPERLFYLIRALSLIHGVLAGCLAGAIFSFRTWPALRSACLFTYAVILMAGGAVLALDGWGSDWSQPISLVLMVASAALVTRLWPQRQP